MLPTTGSAGRLVVSLYVGFHRIGTYDVVCRSVGGLTLRGFSPGWYRQRGLPVGWSVVWFNARSSHEVVPARVDDSLNLKT